MGESVIFPDKVFHQAQAPVFCLYFLYGNAICYHVIEQGIFHVAVIQQLVGQLAIQTAFQLIFQLQELVLILPQRDFTLDMKQAFFHAVIHSGKVADFLL